MLENIPLYAVIGIVVAITISYLNKGAQKKIAPNNEGGFVLRMHKLYLVLGYISISIFLVFTAAIFLTEEPDTTLYVVVLALFFIFGGLGAFCLLFYYNHYLRFNQSNLEVKTALGKTKSTTWDRIIKGSYSPVSTTLTLEDLYGEKLKIHEHLVGLGSFIRIMEEKTTLKARDLKLQVKISKID